MRAIYINPKTQKNMENSFAVICLLYKIEAQISSILHHRLILERLKQFLEGLERANLMRPTMTNCELIVQKAWAQTKIFSVIMRILVPTLNSSQ